MEELADLIEERCHDIVDTLFANNCGYNNGETIARDIRNGALSSEELDNVESYLSVDGKVVGLNRFVSDYLKQSVLGVISTLNLKDYGVEDVGKVELVIPNEPAPIDTAERKATVRINDKNLEINQFTNNIIANSIAAMVSSLKTEGDVSTIDIEIDGIEDENVMDADISLKTNEKPVDINSFSRGILKETVFAIVNSLKIDEKIKNIKIKVEE